MTYAIAPSVAPLHVDRHARRVATMIVVLALLVLSLESWAPLRSRPDAAPAEPAASATAADPIDRGTDEGVAAAERAGIDVDGVLERARHTPRPVAGRPGVLETGDASYRATFDADGFTFAPTGSTGSFGTSLTGLRRGGSATVIEPGPWAPEVGAAERDVAPGVTERVTARDGEVEWDVVLASPPAGAGDLVVTSQVTGTAGTPARLNGSDGPAWRFALPGDQSVLVDELVVKDATGAELFRSLPRYDAGQLSLIVPAAVLDGAEYPLTLDPTVSPSTEIDPGSAGRPSAAFDGTNYLLVYELQAGSDGDVMAVRVNGNGTILGSPVQVSVGPNSDGNTDVAWNGSSFLVVWEIRFASTTTDIDIASRRVSSSGTVIGGTIFISTPIGIQFLPRVAASNSNFLVVWADETSQGSGTAFYDIRATMLSSSGQPVLEQFPVARGPNLETTPDVAWNGTNFLVVWQFSFTDSDLDVIGRLVSTSGGLVGSEIPISTPIAQQSVPVVDSNGTDFLVAWQDNRNGTSDIFGGRVTAAGGTPDGNGFSIAVVTNEQTQPAITFNGAYLVAWRDRRAGGSQFDVFAARVGSNGSVANPGGGFAIANSVTQEANVAVTRGPRDNWGAVYEFRTTPIGIDFKRISPK